MNAKVGGNMFGLLGASVVGGASILYFPTFKDNKINQNRATEDYPFNMEAMRARGIPLPFTYGDDDHYEKYRIVFEK